MLVSVKALKEAVAGVLSEESASQETLEELAIELEAAAREFLGEGSRLKQSRWDDDIRHIFGELIIPGELSDELKASVPAREKEWTELAGNIVHIVTGVKPSHSSSSKDGSVFTVDELGLTVTTYLSAWDCAGTSRGSSEISVYIAIGPQ